MFLVLHSCEQLEEQESFRLSFCLFLVLWCTEPVSLCTSILKLYSKIYWWKAVLLMTWITDLVRSPDGLLPVVVWDSCRMQCNFSEVWGVPQLVCSGTIGAGSQPPCHAVWWTERHAPFQSPLFSPCNLCPLKLLALAYCIPFLPILTKTLAYVIILSYKLNFLVSCLSYLFAMALLTHSYLGNLPSAQCLVQDWSGLQTRRL